MTPRRSGTDAVHFIVVDERGRLLSGACSSPDVAGLIALLDDEPGSVRSLKHAASGEWHQNMAVPRGWSVFAGEARAERSAADAVDDDALEIAGSSSASTVVDASGQ